MPQSFIMNNSMCSCIFSDCGVELCALEAAVQGPELLQPSFTLLHTNRQLLTSCSSTLYICAQL